MSNPENVQLGRICTALQAEDKRRRKNALEELDKLVFGNNRLTEAGYVTEVWETVHQSLVRVLSDQAEACRDLSIELLKKFYQILIPSDRNIIYVVPVASRRLASQEIVEPSEEVRLNFVTLLRIIVDKYKDYIPAYLDDFVAILGKTVIDNYPSIKKESCSCISELAKAVPRHFYNRSDSLVKPVLLNFTHQHHKVRVSAVDAIGDIVQYGNNKTIEEVATPMAERLFDQSAAVRMGKDLIVRYVQKFVISVIAKNVFYFHFSSCYSSRRTLAFGT